MILLKLKDYLGVNHLFLFPGGRVHQLRRPGDELPDLPHDQEAASQGHLQVDVQVIELEDVVKRAGGTQLSQLLLVCGRPRLSTSH